jgi:hypothetical protein
MSCCLRGRTAGGVKLTIRLYSVPRLSGCSVYARAALCFYVAWFLIHSQRHIYLYFLPCEVVILLDLYFRVNEKSLVLGLQFFFLLVRTWAKLCRCKSAVFLPGWPSVAWNSHLHR